MSESTGAVGEHADLKSYFDRFDVEQCWRVVTVAIVAYTFLLRVVYAAHVELLPEETYYWNYARHLDIGYLDHPPMVAWLIKVGTTLFGNSQFGVRFGALCCGVATAAFVYRLTLNVFGGISASMALIFSQVLPFFFLSGLLMTPDAPLTAAWAATLYFLERALVAGRSRAWLWAGASLGLGLLSKYTIGMLAVAALSFVVLDPPSRHWLRRWEPYVAALTAAVVFSPVIVWNAQHEWASFAFQTSRRLAERPRFSLHKLIGGAMVLITPVGVVAVGRALVRKGDDIPAGRLLRLALWVPLTVFFVFSLRHEVKLDWTGAPWIAALPLLAHALARSCGDRVSVPRGWLRIAWPPTFAILMLLYGVGWFYLVPGLPGVGYTSQTELIPVAWREFAVQVDRIAVGERIRHGGDLLVIGMDRYAIASEVAFYSPDQSRSVASTSTSHLFGGVGLMYERWFPAAMQAGRPLLLVGWNRESLDTPLLREHLDVLEPVEEGSLTRNGFLVRHFYCRVVLGYAPDAKSAAAR